MTLKFATHTHTHKHSKQWNDNGMMVVYQNFVANKNNIWLIDWLITIIYLGEKKIPINKRKSVKLLIKINNLENHCWLKIWYDFKCLINDMDHYHIEFDYIYLIFNIRKFWKKTWPGKKRLPLHCHWKWIKEFVSDQC